MSTATIEAVSDWSSSKGQSYTWYGQLGPEGAGLSCSQSIDSLLLLMQRYLPNSWAGWIQP